MKNNAIMGKRVLYFTKSISFAFFLTFVLPATVVAATTYAENKLFTIALHGQPLKKVVEYVESNSDFVFIWETNVDLNREVNVDVRNKSVQEILDQMFAGTGLEYRINGKQVIIRQAQTASRPNADSRKRTVSGVVTDASGIPLIGASVSLKGESGKGVITDMDGKFSLPGVTDKDILYVSYVGYVSLEVKIGSRSSFNLVLEENTELLGEVVVTALGIKREEKALGYSADWITDELLDVMAREEKIVKYLDIPLQHCNKKVLQEMNRRGDRESLTALMRKIREKVPGIVLRTTLITGFPGETEEQFEELCQFVQEIRFERLGCFPYSAEEGTPAGERTDQVDPEVRQRRADIIMELQMGIMEEYNQGLLGSDLEVVVEGYDRYAASYFGRSAADAPDIDGKIFFTSRKKPAVGQYLPVHIDDVLDYDLIGSAL